MRQAAGQVHRLDRDDIVCDELIAESPSDYRKSYFVKTGNVADLVRLVQGPESLSLVLKDRRHPDTTFSTALDPIKELRLLPLLKQLSDVSPSTSDRLSHELINLRHLISFLNCLLTSYTRKLTHPLYLRICRRLTASVV